MVLQLLRGPAVLQMLRGPTFLQLVVPLVAVPSVLRHLHSSRLRQDLARLLGALQVRQAHHLPHHHHHHRHLLLALALGRLAVGHLAVGHLDLQRVQCPGNRGVPVCCP